MNRSAGGLGVLWKKSLAGVTWLMSAMAAALHEPARAAVELA
jgi:hypothetical protein